MSEENTVQVVRAKMFAHKLTANPRAPKGCEGEFTIELTAVYDLDPESENGRFFKYTPTGQITLGILNPSIKDFFVPGKAYYVDFTLAPAPEETPAD